MLTYTDGSHAEGPAVAVTAPLVGTTITGSTVTLAANATDDRRVEKVEFYVDGVLKGTDTSSPYSLVWDSTSVANGTHTFSSVGYDDAGNSATSSGVAVSVDNTALPTVSLSAPTAGSYGSAVQADSPAGWWRLNETSGTTAADSSGNSHSGTYRGGTSLNVEGALANDTSIAAHFPGSANGDDVAVPDAAGLDFGTGDFTAEAWVKTSVNGERVIMGKFSGVGTSPNWRVTVTNDAAPWTGRIRATIYDGSTGRTAYGPTIRVDDGEWHHVAVAFSRSAGVSVYVDGVGRTTTGVPAGSVDNNEPLRIGDTEGYSAFQGDIDEAAVYPSALSAARIQAHFDAGIIRGAHALAAIATDDVSVSKVEFYADEVRVGEDATSPYTAQVDTLDASSPLYDGPRVFAAKAYDSSNQVVTSAEVTRTVANGGYSKYRGTFATTAMPQTILYDPAPTTQEQVGVDVTVTNTSTMTWPAADVKLRYRWISLDTPAVYTDSAPVALASDLVDGASATLRLLIDPPVLPEGVDRASYRLRFDLYDYAASSWFGANGNLPVENPIVVNKVVTAGLGLERFYQYEAEAVGVGMESMTNVASGNMLLRWAPFTSPGRGLSTVVGLTYNSLEKGGDSPAGNNFSLGISSLTRLGSRLDVHPNNADSIAGRSNKWVQLTDSDGTRFRFDGITAPDGTTYWSEPPGVHLYLREFSTTDATKKWALTRPDRVTFFYDEDGYPTGVEDANGNRLNFTLTPVDPGDDPGGPAKRVTAVTDASGTGSTPATNRTYNIDYYTKAEVKKAQLRGKVQRIADHDGSALDFEYYEDGNLLSITQRGGAAEDAPTVADRSIVFTYTTSAGDGPAIPNSADRVDPDPRTSPQSTRLYSVRDPLGSETTFAYYGPTSGQLRWRLASRTNRAGSTTSFSYNLTTRVATVAAPMSRSTSYAYDTEGKVTSITNPKNETTTVEWTPDRMVAKVTEPTGKYTEFAYNDNGYVTDTWDQLRNRTNLEYTNVAVDVNDVSGKWRSGRTIPHVSQLAKKTDPKGVATASPTDDFQWEFGYNSLGNLTTVTDPENKTTSFGRNADGTVSSITDASANPPTTFLYEANGLVKEATDALGNKTYFEWSPDGQLLWSQDANHAAYSATDDVPDLLHRKYTYYDAFQRAVRQSTPESTATSGRVIWTGVEHDANDNVVKSYAPEFDGMTGAVTTVSYDAMDRPRLVTEADTLVDPAGERIALDYDAAGRVAKETSPRGVVTTNTNEDFAVFYDYDDLDRVIRQHRKAVTGATVDETLTAHACYDLAGDLVRVAPPKAGTAYDCSASPAPDFTTEFTYDDAHRRLSTKDSEARTTSVTYDANGNIATQTDAESMVTTLEYDQRNLLIKVIEPFDAAASRSVTTRIEYDNVGNRDRLISPRAWDASTDKSTFTEYVTSFVYDDLNRLEKVVLPTSTADGEQLYVYRAYDAVGNVVTTTLPDAATTIGAVAQANKTTVTYLDTGLVRGTTIGTRPGVTYDYTASGLQSSRFAPDAEGEVKKEFWEYYNDDMLREHRDAKDARSEYAYNENNLLTTATERTALATESAKAVEATYNSLDQVIKTRSKSDGASTWTYSTMRYDDNGNVDRREDDGKEGGQTLAPRVVDFVYDKADWLDVTTDLGVIAPVDDKSDDQKVDSDFTPTGREEKRDYSTSDALGTFTLQQRTTWDHFDNGKLKTVSTHTGSNAATLLETHTVGYFDAAGIYVNGHRTTTTTRTNTYDGALLVASSVTGGQSHKYFHDADGNLECVTLATGAAVDCGVGEGVPISEQLVSQYTHNYLNQLGDYQSFTTDGTTSVADDHATYEYDALDRVVKQTEVHGASAQRVVDFFHVGLSSRLSSEKHSVGGTLEKTLTYGYDAFGHRVTMGDARGTGTDRYTYGYDVHGSASLLVSQSGLNAGDGKATYGYRPYGDPDAGLTQGDPQDDDPINPMRYSAKRYDSGSGSLDMGARRYNSGVGRFLEFDQYNGALANLSLSMDALTGNRYALAGGNPVGYAEWDGHISLPDGSAGAGDPRDCQVCRDIMQTNQNMQRHGETGRETGGGAGPFDDPEQFRQDVNLVNETYMGSSMWDADREQAAMCWSWGCEESRKFLMRNRENTTEVIAQAITIGMTFCETNADECARRDLTAEIGISLLAASYGYGAGKVSGPDAPLTTGQRLRNRVGAPNEAGAVGGRSGKLSSAQAGDLARWLGFRPAGGWRIKGQQVFTDGRYYIVQDIDQHLPNATWKLARRPQDLNRQRTRLGTYDYRLNRIGD